MKIISVVKKTHPPKLGSDARHQTARWWACLNQRLEKWQGTSFLAANSDTAREWPEVNDRLRYLRILEGGSGEIRKFAQFLKKFMGIMHCRIAKSKRLSKDEAKKVCSGEFFRFQIVLTVCVANVFPLHAS